MRVDAIFRRGRIHTLDPLYPLATNMAVLSGRVVALDEDVNGLTANRDYDLQGLTVVPGFHDAHAHTVHFGFSLGEVDLGKPTVNSLSELYQAVENRARSTPKGEWIIGSGYDQNKLGGHPERSALDAIAPEHFVWLQHTSKHMSVVNTRVLDQINTGHVPEGGSIARDEAGELTGLFQEQAQNLVRELVYPYPSDEISFAIGRAHEVYLREGITSVQEAGIGGAWIGHSPGEFAAFQSARDSERLRVRTTTMIAAEVLHSLAHDVSAASLDLGIRTGIGDDWLRIGPVKIFADGSLIGRTAAMHLPFEGEPDNIGLLQIPPDELRQLILGAHMSGWQIATHAIGDRAVDLVVAIYRETLLAYPRADHRHRIEHCAISSIETVGAIAALGLIPVPQGRFVGSLGDGMRAALGASRTRQCYRQKSFIEAGVVLPGSSDRPVAEGAPLRAIHDLVNQRTDSGELFNPQEALTPREALAAYTIGSAYSTFAESSRGRLVNGMLADFAVLSEDVLEVSPGRIRDLEVVMTGVNGNVVYDAAGIS